jgi:predicted RNase H-like nuclease (RuvC/YqgF family)
MMTGNFSDEPALVKSIDDAISSLLLAAKDWSIVRSKLCATTEGFQERNQELKGLRNVLADKLNANRDKAKRIRHAVEASVEENRMLRENNQSLQTQLAEEKDREIQLAVRLEEFKKTKFVEKRLAVSIVKVVNSHSKDCLCFHQPQSHLHNTFSSSSSSAS